MHLSISFTSSHHLKVWVGIQRQAFEDGERAEDEGVVGRHCGARGRNREWAHGRNRELSHGRNRELSHGRNREWAQGRNREWAQGGGLPVQQHSLDNLFKHMEKI